MVVDEVIEDKVEKKDKKIDPEEPKTTQEPEDAGADEDSVMANAKVRP